jgi:predicted nucleotidyltransferase
LPRGGLLPQIVHPFGVTELHRSVASRAAASLVAGGDVLAVLLAGSVARGSARPDSDVDLLVVCPEDVTRPVRYRRVNGLLVEVAAKSQAEWEQRFRRSQPMWVYAWLDAEALHDGNGVAARLSSLARLRFADYRAPAELRQGLAGFWWHVRPKMAAVLAAGDLQAVGYFAGTILEAVVETVFAVHDRPLPPGSQRFEVLKALPLPPERRELLARLCVGDPAQRLGAALELVDGMAPLLGEPDFVR